MAIISECRYRWLRVPATTFIITLCPGLTAGAAFEFLGEGVDKNLDNQDLKLRGVFD